MLLYIYIELDVCVPNFKTMRVRYINLAVDRLHTRAGALTSLPLINNLLLLLLKYMVSTNSYDVSIWLLW